MPENPYHSPVTPPTPPPLPTGDRTPWNAWWTLLWAVLLFIVWQMVMTVGVLIVAFQQGLFRDLSDQEDFGEKILDLSTDGDVLGLLAFVTIFFVCPLCWFLGHVRPGFSGWGYLGNQRPKWWHWPAWGAATVGCSVVFGLLAPYLGIEEESEFMVSTAGSTQMPVLLYLGVGIGAPLVEEFIFRGVLWRGWRASKLGLAWTLFLTSFLWAIPHVQYPAVMIAYIFVLGLILGLAREKTGSIWIPVWMHALNNGIATLHMLQL